MSWHIDDNIWLVFKDLYALKHLRYFSQKISHEHMKHFAFDEASLLYTFNNKTKTFYQ